MTRQAREASNLSNCDFKIRSVENVELMGVSFQHVKSINDLGVAGAARIMAGLASPSMPLSLQLNLEGKNPNDRQAGLNRLEWILYIDDMQMTSGVLNEPFVIPPRGSAIIPVNVSMDLKTVLTGKSAEALMKFAMNLSGSGTEPTRFRIRLKPTILVGKSELRYPGYINVNLQYSGEK